jgi:tRNA dimethylallyltransferase
LKFPFTNTLFIVAGPTAAGKTATAITIAKHFGTEIISADSRQCYKELNIGVARPSEAELKKVPHHFIASHSIHEEVTAITFEQYALQITNELFQQHNKVVMVGGTGLYIKAFCEGLDAIPTIHSAIRENLTKQYALNGLGWLQQMVKEKDPTYFSTGEIQNPQRLMRALEVIEGTGHSITTFQKKQKAARDFNIIKIGLALPREILVQRIHDRVDLMLQQGQLEEVKSLIPYQHLNALQTVGYAELFEHLNGKSTLSSAIESIKTHTRQYAKRQMTWFKKDEEIKWFSPANAKAIIDYLAHK